MSLIRLAWKNIRNKPWSTLLSLILFALGTGLIAVLLLMQRQLQENFERNLAGIDLVIGAKGSPLQLILSSMYHIDAPTGNISLKEIKPFLNPKHPLIGSAIPLSLGDSYRGYRIVGTTKDFLTLYHAEIQEGRLWEANMEVTIGAQVAATTGLKIGDTFKSSHGFEEEVDAGHVDHLSFEVVGILATSGTVADQLILTTNQSFWLVHGETGHEHHSDSTSTGHVHEADSVHSTDKVDAETQAHDHEHGDEHHAHDEHEHSGQLHEEHDHDHHAADTVRNQAQQVQSGSQDEHAEDQHAHDDHDHSGHAHEEHDHEDHAQSEEQHMENLPAPKNLLDENDELDITSLLITFKATNYQALNMQRSINENTDMQAATPAIEINRLFSLMSSGERILRLLAWIITLVSGLSVFISLFSSLRDRRYELALLRVMGAGRGTLFLLIILEGVLMAGIGCLIGLLLSHGAMEVLGGLLEEEYRYRFTGLRFLHEETWLIAGALIVGFVAALIPAVQASKTDIATTLTEN